MVKGSPAGGSAGFFLYVKIKSICGSLKHKKKNPNTNLFGRKNVFGFSSIGRGQKDSNPSTKVLETHVLPLHHTPKHLFSIT